MEGLGPRWLILLTVTATMATAMSAGADVRRRRPGRDDVLDEPAAAPSYQRVVFTPAMPRSHTRRCRTGLFSEIAEASARYAVPERLIWPSSEWNPASTIGRLPKGARAHAADA